MANVSQAEMPRIAGRGFILLIYLVYLSPILTLLAVFWLQIPLEIQYESGVSRYGIEGIHAGENAPLVMLPVWLGAVLVFVGSISSLVMIFAAATILPVIRQWQAGAHFSPYICRQMGRFAWSLVAFGAALALREPVCQFLIGANGYGPRQISVSVSSQTLSFLLAIAVVFTFVRALRVAALYEDDARWTI